MRFKQQKVKAYEEQFLVPNVQLYIFKPDVSPVKVETFIANTIDECAADIIRILRETREAESNSPFTVEEAISRIKSNYDTYEEGD